MKFANTNKYIVLKEIEFIQESFPLVTQLLKICIFYKKRVINILKLKHQS